MIQVEEIILSMKMNVNLYLNMSGIGGYTSRKTFLACNLAVYFLRERRNFTRIVGKLMVVKKKLRTKKKIHLVVHVIVDRRNKPA